jgi:carboxymethylenebutenolidase
MALLEKNVVVTTRHGRMHAFAACPDAPGDFPAIILYMDAPGFREELCNQARRIAKHGYFCLLPDMYYRYGTLRFDIPRRYDAMSAVIKSAYTNLSNAEVTDDTAGLLAYLDAQDKVTPGPVGCVGHCMSGQYVTTVAARFAHRFKAVAALYGVQIVTEKPDSPHLLVDQIKGEMFYGFAETDPSVPDHVIPTLAAALEKARVKHRIKVFPGTQHGFCFPERPSYAAAASEEAWAMLFELWDRNLKAARPA